jgi:BirA family biotin operon repressor/biotin-[acetyl-CoA-carboxylase] ligase
MIDVAKVQKGLKAKIFGRKVYAFDSIDSTNNCARALAGNDCPEGSVVVAEYQTAGKGRLGRIWIADAGENLTFSTILRPKISPEGLNLLPLVAAVAVARGVTKTTGMKPDCKWPNDLLVGGKKFCGILLEGVSHDNGFDYVIAGIGINVNQSVFPPDLHERATSLRAASGHPINREDLLRSILEYFEELYLLGKKEEFRTIPEIWLTHSTMIGKGVEVESEGTVFSGRASGIAPDGALILTTASGTRSVYAGDVTLRPLDHQSAPHATDN